MHRGMKIAAVLPAYNEGGFIHAAVDFLPREVFDDVIVVDDASSDETAEVARAAGATHVITHAVNQGVGGAIVTGFKAAVERGNDVAVVIPGDGQADLGALERMLDRSAEGFGLVISDRLTGRDASTQGMPKYRIFGSRVLSLMTRVATGLHVPDPQSGYKAIRREAIERLPLDELYKRWGFHNDVLSHLALQQVPVTTVLAEPVYTSPDGRRITSHIKLWDLIPRHARVFSRMAARRVLHLVRRPPVEPWKVPTYSEE